MVPHRVQPVGIIMGEASESSVFCGFDMFDTLIDTGNSSNTSIAYNTDELWIGLMIWFNTIITAIDALDSNVNALDTFMKEK